MRRYLHDWYAIFFVLLVVIVVFLRLFLPEPQLIVTPDFGKSDAWHFSFATKYALSEALRSNTLPLWRTDIGDGFPLLAEGQTGTFFLPNLLLFKALPAQTAYNIALITAIATLALGMYGVARITGLTIPSALFAALLLSFSGLPIVQLTHITLLQGISMLPVVLFLTIWLSQKISFPRMGLLACAITQQIFAGFPQAAFLTLLLASSYTLWILYTEKAYKPCVAFGVAVVFGFAGAAAQIIPSWEFLQASTNPSGFGFMDATQYSMPLKHLITFLSPFALGNPKLGTYPPFFQFDGSIFWENTAYFGLLPLMYIVVAWLMHKKIRHVQLYTALLLGSICMAWGKHSPLYIVFTIWPFNLFRVPSRFLWITVFSAALLAASGFDVLIKHVRFRGTRLLLIASILVTFIQLGSFWWSYHLFMPVTHLLPQVGESDNRIKGKIHTLGMPSMHNKYFIQNGWLDQAPYLTLYTEAYAADSNMIFGVQQHDIYAGRFLYRSSLTDSLLAQIAPFDDTAATISSEILMNLLGIRTVISYLPVTSQHFRLTDTTVSNGITRRIYENPNALPRAYLVKSATSAATLNEAIPRLHDPSFVPGSSALLETKDVTQHPMLASFLRQPLQKANNVTSLYADTHTSLSLQVDSGTSISLLILTDTYYPGWVADIDGKETPIYPANLKQRAIVVPEGSHTVHFRYRPQSVRLGLIISAAIELIVVVLMVIPVAVQSPRIGKIIPLRALRHPRNPDK